MNPVLPTPPLLPWENRTLFAWRVSGFGAFISSRDLRACFHRTRISYVAFQASFYFVKQQVSLPCLTETIDCIGDDMDDMDDWGMMVDMAYC